MRWSARLRGLMAMGLVTMILGAGTFGSEWANELEKLPASTVDPALPDARFADWLEENLVRYLPHSTTDALRFEPCVTDRSDCMTLDIDIPSRARSLVLRFDRGTFRFLGGIIVGLELEAGPPLASLAELPDRFGEGMRPYPLGCPEGTSLTLEEEHAGLREWCEDSAGVKQGPARAWFSTGYYLMYRGTYRDGERDGAWFECDRFERCARRHYIGGIEIPPKKGG